MSTSVSKIVAERNHRTLIELVLKPGNDICADCKARAPRWASYNLGIFVCVHCASIHRKIGTHITKVKSITLDEWSKEQVEVMKEKGNIKSNALYNPDEARHPPPTNMIDLERDSELERFIRSKYEFKRFMNRKSGHASQHLTAGPHAAPTVPRPRSTPLTGSTQIERKASPPGPPLPPKTPENLPLRLRPLAIIPSQNAPPTRSFSQPLPPLTNSEKLTAAPPITSVSSQPQVSVQQQPTTLGTAPNPFMNLSLGQFNTTTPFASPMSLSTPGPQFPFVPSAPPSSPALHFGATNPFNQAPLAASANGTAFSTSSNPFSTSTIPVPMATSTPTTPSMQPAIALPTGSLLHTPPLPYITSQMSTPTPAVSFPAMPFAPGPAATCLAPNPFAPVGAPGQMSFSSSGATNPFLAMQMGQAGFPGASPQTAFGTTAFLSQQQQQQQQGPNGFGGWAGQGSQGMF